MFFTYTIQVGQTRQTGLESFHVPERYTCLPSEHVSNFSAKNSRIKFYLEGRNLGWRKGKRLSASQSDGSMLAIKSLGEDCISILHAFLHVCFYRKVFYGRSVIGRQWFGNFLWISMIDWLKTLKVIAILEILHFVVHQSKKGIKKYYEANPDAIKISEVKFFNPYESEKYRRKNFKGSIKTIDSVKWLDWTVCENIWM